MHRREYLFQIKNGLRATPSPSVCLIRPILAGANRITSPVRCSQRQVFWLISLATPSQPFGCEPVCGQWSLWYNPLFVNILQTMQGENHSSEYCFGFGVFRCPFLRPYPSFSGSPFVGLSVLPTEFPFAPPSVETVYDAKIVKKNIWTNKMVQNGEIMEIRLCHKRISELYLLGL